jgi:hypothetical protein
MESQELKRQIAGASFLGGARAIYRVRSIKSVSQLLTGIGLGIVAAKSIQDLKDPIDYDLRKGVREYERTFQVVS